MSKLFLMAMVLAASSALAVENPVTDIRRYDGPAPENVIRVATARVVYADYLLIIHDYPEARALAEKYRGNAEATKRAIDEWILETAGYIARTQVLNPLAAEIHEPIAADFGKIVTAYRPEGYRRGLVFKSKDGKHLLDGKGFGSPDPRAGTNTNGLMSLDEALSEILKEKVVFGVGEASGGKFTTVRCLAAIDWGFEMKLPEGGTSRAGAVLRQPHTREYWNFNSNLPESAAVPVELELRKYGLTSTGQSTTLRGQAQHGYDLINIQGKELPDGPAIVDFGTIVRLPNEIQFSKPLAVRMRRMYEPLADNPVWASRNILSPALGVDEKTFVRAIENPQAIPFDLFGVPDLAHPYPEFDRVRVSSAQAVERYRSALAAGSSPEAARQLIETYMGAMLSSVKLPGASCIGALTDPAFHR